MRFADRMMRKRRTTQRKRLDQIVLFYFWQEEVDAELRQMELSDRDAQGTLRELLTQWRLPLLVTTTLAVFQQLSGQSNVLNYMAEIQQASGFAAIAAPAVWLGCVKLFFTSLAIFFIDEFGRRPFLLMGASGSTASLWLLSIGFLAETPVLSFLACCSLVACYSISFGPVTWLVTGQ